MLKLPICVLLAATTSTSQAFSFVNNRSLQQSTSTTAFLVTKQHQKCEQRRSKLIAFAESTEESENVEAEITDDEPKSASEETEEAEAEEEEEKEPEEDAELTALKSEIAQLESQLKQKNRDLNSLERMADEYTKAGYARKVAEMESFRRSKSAASTDNKIAARAAVLEDFLPVMEDLREVNAKYEDNEFAKSYSALCWDFNNALKDLGVAEFTVKEGDKADGVRVLATREEYSETVAKGMVIEPLEIGYELEGNLMRGACAVVSLGPESSEEEEISEEAAEEDTASDEAKSEE